ncbi:MAG TPA: PDZ domain-containing protein [Thermoanaerobaculia bacterium]|jgi:predicted metalloprotease with PDZ domain|nr:PDZ domain-containing protein [Thermoanaerobaculia bacterium]
MQPAPAPGGSGGEPIRYTLTFPAPETHYVEVDASLPTGGRPQIDLFQPVWTPGSYKVRDYARHVEALRAESAGGNPLPIEKLRKNRWRLTTWGAPRVHLMYRVYGRELTVRTNFVDRDFALLNGAATFLTLADGCARRHEVAVVLPAHWRQAHTALPTSPQGGPHLFHAADYDTLVDSPIYCGTPAVYPFEVDGVPHLLVDEGEDGVWNGPRSAADLERIVHAAFKLWGEVPYRRFLFLNLITGASGGLEHKDSTVLMTSRWKTRRRESYLEWLGLAAHEHFHAWNVKRLRPAELGPFDYDAENYTKSLWVAEGITAYYDDLLVHRAGLSSRDEYLRDFSKTVRTAQRTPGRRVQTLEAASFDTWIKYYQPDENTPNSSISYYTKGAVVAFLLDTRIRQATDGQDVQKSLDDVLRLAWQRFAGERGFTGAEIEALASEVAGEDLAAFFDRALRSTEELDFSAALQWYGLRFAEDPAPVALPAPAPPDAEAERAAPSPAADAVPAGAVSVPAAPVVATGPPVEKPGWLGMVTRVDGGRLIVVEVRRGTPAFDAGISVDDELIAIDDFRVPPDRLAERLAFYRPGDAVSVVVARRERLLRLEAVLGEDPGEGWRLAVDPRAGDAQRARLAAWLAGAVTAS